MNIVFYLIKYYTMQVKQIDFLYYNSSIFTFIIFIDGR